MKKKVGIIGGDIRIEKLIGMFIEEEVSVYTYCLENLQVKEKNKYSNFKKNIEVCKSIDEILINSDIIITSIPFTKDGKHIYSEYSDMDVNINEFFKTIENTRNLFIKNKTIYTTNVSKELLDKFNKVDSKVKIIDMLKVEEFSILNSIATAEGTLSIAIQKSKRNLQDSTILILGYGRTAKVIANKFKYLSNSIACTSRNKEELVWIKANGYTSIEFENFKNNIANYDIIINTIPAVILNENELKKISKETLIIDIASKPGGVDQKYIKKYGINYIQELGIPGKLSPITSAEIIKNIIL